MLSRYKMLCKRFLSHISCSIACSLLSCVKFCSLIFPNGLSICFKTFCYHCLKPDVFIVQRSTSLSSPAAQSVRPWLLSAVNHSVILQPSQNHKKCGRQICSMSFHWMFLPGSPTGEFAGIK